MTQAKCKVFDYCWVFSFSLSLLNTRSLSLMSWPRHKYIRLSLINLHRPFPWILHASKSQNFFYLHLCCVAVFSNAGNLSKSKADTGSIRCSCSWEVVVCHRSSRWTSMLADEKQLLKYKTLQLISTVSSGKCNLHHVASYFFWQFVLNVIRTFSLIKYQCKVQYLNKIFSPLVTKCSS